MYENKELKILDKEQPMDTVSQIVWDRNISSDPKFLASSWDGFIRLYGVKAEQFGPTKVDKLWEVFLQHPVLCADYNDGIAFAGLASGEIVAVQCSTSITQTLGSHEAPICGLFWIKEFNVLMSLGFDNVVKFWSIENSNSLLAEFKLPLKTATCSFSFPWLLVGSIEATIAIINVKLPNLPIPKPEQYRRINLERFSKFNCSRVHAGSNLAVVGTVDGRALVFNFKECLNGDFEPLNHYVSRVQKRTEKNSALFTQVNALDIGNATTGSFVAIGGSDDLAVYNSNKKSKVKNLCPMGLMTGASTAVSFSPNYEFIAFGVGCDWLKGLFELQTMKRAKLVVVRLSKNDIAQFSSK